MRRGDQYVDYNGNEYEFFTIAIPMQDDMIHTLHLQKFIVAKHHDKDVDFDVYTCSDGATFIDADIPYVLYQRKEDHNTEHVLVLELNEFFSSVDDFDGGIVARFSLKD